MDFEVNFPPVERCNIGNLALRKFKSLSAHTRQIPSSTLESVVYRTTTKQRCALAEYYTVLASKLARQLPVNRRYL